MVISPALFAVVDRLHGSRCEMSVAVSPALGAAYQLRSQFETLGKANVLSVAIKLKCF